MKNFILFLFCFLINITSGLGQLETPSSHFDGTRVINGHSVETLFEGEMESLIGHRFGRINGGVYELFGLDQATIRLGLDYGIKNWLTIGIGRSSLGKTYDSFLKIRILQQKASKKSPIALTLLSSVALNTLRSVTPNEEIPFISRLAYTWQIITSRRVTDRLVVQLMPTMVHFNLVDNENLKNDVYALGITGKYRLSKTVAMTTEYYYNLPGRLDFNNTNSLSFGVDLNTGSHVFQLHFTNSAGMIEKSYIGETTGKWSNGDIHFGFNMVRTFKLKGRRY